MHFSIAKALLSYAAVVLSHGKAFEWNLSVCPYIE